MTSHTLAIPKQISTAPYTGLAEAHIRRYNNCIKDLTREIRLGRGDDKYADALINDEIPKIRRLALKEMASQDLRHGRITDTQEAGA